MVTPAKIIYDMSDEEYHSDPCRVASLSASTAHTIVSKSPLHAWSQHPKLGGRSRKPTKELDRGAILHALLLGAGRSFVVVRAPEGEEEFQDFRKKKAKEARDEARAAGKIPLLQHQVNGLEVVADELRQRIGFNGVHLTGKSEVTIIWEDEGVLCRARTDHLILNEHDATIYDLKMVASAHPRAIQAHMEEYGSDIQAHVYPRAVAAVRPELAGRVAFRFVFCEPEPPYAVVVAEPSGTMRELGELRWNRGREAWRECLSSGTWPGYATELLRVEARPFTLQAEMTATYGEDYRL